MPLGMSAQLSLLLLSFTATPTALLALQQGTGLTVECGSSSHSQGAFKLGSESMMLEGLACSAMAVAIPGLTQLTCTSYTVLSYPVLSCCDVSCRVVSCPVLSCLVVSGLVASSIMLAWHGMPWGRVSRQSYIDSQLTEIPSHFNISLLRALNLFSMLHLITVQPPSILTTLPIQIYRLERLSGKQ